MLIVYFIYDRALVFLFSRVSALGCRSVTKGGGYMYIYTQDARVCSHEQKMDLLSLDEIKQSKSRCRFDSDANARIHVLYRALIPLFGRKKVRLLYTHSAKLHFVNNKYTGDEQRCYYSLYGTYTHRETYEVKEIKILKY